MDRCPSHRFHLKLQSMPLTDIRDVLGGELNRRLRFGNKLITGCGLHTVNVTQGRWN